MSRLVTRGAAILVCGWVFLPPTRVPDTGTVILAVACGLAIESLGRWVAKADLL